MKNNRHYYVSGHTRIGYFSVLPDLSNDLECMFVLKDLSMKQADEVLHEIADYMKGKGERIDYFHSPSHNDYIEGVKLQSSKVAIVSIDAIKNLQQTFSSPRVIFISFSEAFDTNKKIINKSQIIQLEKERDYQYQLAYDCFGEAKQFHERKEQIYIKSMDFSKADEIANKLQKALFHNKKRKRTKVDSETIFFGAATPKGAVHFIEELTSHMNKRYIIKGRSGGGKSTLMRKISKKAEERGLNVTYFLCGFDPTSIDMIIIEDLSIAILDGTAPHIINPSSERDKVIDMFELCMDPSVEEAYTAEIEECEKNYKACMQKGTAYLKKAKEIQTVIDEYYDVMVNEEQYVSVKEGVVQKITSPINAS